MIRKLNNGNTLITLGEGTVYTSNIHMNGCDRPFGICFSKEKELSEDAVILQITSDEAVVTYIMALIRYLEAQTDGDSLELTKTLQKLKEEFEPKLPKENKSNENSNNVRMTMRDWEKHFDTLIIDAHGFPSNTKRRKTRFTEAEFLEHCQTSTLRFSEKLREALRR